MFSNNKIILADFGASRIKSIIIDVDTGKILDSQEEKSPSTVSDFSHPLFAINIEKYYQAFANTVLSLLNRHDNVLAIYLCSEMHGFTLFDGDNFMPYVSWKDTRTNIKDYVSESEWFLEKTGMRLRPGLPYLNIKSCIDKNKNYKFYTLIDAILELAGCKNIKSDYSLAAGTGLVNIHDENWSKELCPFDNISFHDINKDLSLPIGNLGSVKIYGGIGDLQAAVLGSGINQYPVINLGTGSQVICKDYATGYELRPYVKDYLRVITHIPCGRALNIISNFFESIVPDTNFFWDHWFTLKVSDIMNAKVNVDLNFFESAWKYNNGGFITFEEDRFNFKDILANIARSWVEQYIEALNILDPNYEYSKIQVSGGLARSPFVLEVLNSLDSKRTYVKSEAKLSEETFEGLYNLYKLNNSLPREILLKDPV